MRGVSKAKIESLPILGSAFKNASQFPEAELVRRLRFWLVQFPALSICQLDRVLVVASTQHQIPIVAVRKEHRFRLARDRSEAGVGCSRSQEFDIQL